jgi:3-oxoacyl-[acyl-carrier-protein] synthase II
MRRVVVTGIGAVTPLGTGVPAYFDGLLQARSAVGTVTRFDPSSFDAHLAAEVKDLDPAQVTLPEPEAEGLRRDPKSLYGLVAAREALRQAFGARPTSAVYSPRRIGAFVAAGLEICHVEDLLPYFQTNAIDAGGLYAAIERAPKHSRYLIPADLGFGCIVREAQARGANQLNLSACAAGTMALGEAFLAIQDGAIDAAVAGGYDSMVNPLGFGGFCMLGALSKANARGASASRPFDSSRDGFVLGEGAAMCVFEEYEAARRRGATLLGEVFGYAATLDAFRVSDPHPAHAGAVRALREALERAELGPDAVDYINAHGTGTRKNDPAEAAAIRTVFQNAAHLPVSSTKSQIGHLIGAAGAVEFLAGLFAVQHGVVPATVNLDDPDPDCALDHVAHTPRPHRTRVFVSNSFGFGGQNAVIVAGAVR